MGNAAKPNADRLGMLTLPLMIGANRYLVEPKHNGGPFTNNDKVSLPVFEGRQTYPMISYRQIGLPGRPGAVTANTQHPG